ncbi:MAG: lasso peptide biosynthesis B2 protein [Hyphomonadaceae bacterium]
MDYHFAPDVHACRSSDLIVFLDVGQDRYFAAPGDACELDAPRRMLRACNEEGLRWGAKLLAQGLVRETAAAVEVMPHRSPLKTVWLPKTPAYIAALLWAGAALDRRRGLGRAIEELSKRRADTPVDSLRARSEAALFASWRPLWPRAFVCLHDTLALTWFLSARRASCEIVFGVQARPFAAHCWAEAGGEVLNDDAEYCAAFDVILRA